MSFGSPAAYERPAMSAEGAGGSRGSSSSDTARAAGGEGRVRSRRGSDVRPLDPKAGVFRPAAAWGG